MIANIIVGVIIIAIITAATAKIVSEKKKGVKCVGCPYSGTTDSSKCSCSHDH